MVYNQNKQKYTVGAPVLKCFQPSLHILLDVSTGASLALSKLLLGVRGLTGALGTKFFLEFQHLLFVSCSEL